MTTALAQQSLLPLFEVSNNRIYFGANQHDKYQSCGLSQTLRINDDLPIVIDGKRRFYFEIEVSFLTFYNIRNITVSQLSFFVSNRSDERLLEYLGRDKL